MHVRVTHSYPVTSVPLKKNLHGNNKPDRGTLRTIVAVSVEAIQLMKCQLISPLPEETQCASGHRADEERTNRTAYRLDDPRTCKTLANLRSGGDLVLQYRLGQSVGRESTDLDHFE